MIKRQSKTIRRAPQFQCATCQTRVAVGVQCAGCAAWFHTHCVANPTSLSAPAVPFLCASCIVLVQPTTTTTRARRTHVTTASHLAAAKHFDGSLVSFASPLSSAPRRGARQMNSNLADSRLELSSPLGTAPALQSQPQFQSQSLLTSGGDALDASSGSVGDRLHSFLPQTALERSISSCVSATRTVERWLQQLRALVGSNSLSPLLGGSDVGFSMRRRDTSQSVLSVDDDAEGAVGAQLAAVERVFLKDHAKDDEDDPSCSSFCSTTTSERKSLESSLTTMRIRPTYDPPTAAAAAPPALSSPQHHRVYLDNRHHGGGGDDQVGRGGIPSILHTTQRMQQTKRIEDMAPQLLQHMDVRANGVGGGGHLALDRETIVDAYERYAVIAAAEDLAHEVELRRKRQLLEEDLYRRRNLLRSRQNARHGNRRRGGAGDAMPFRVLADGHQKMYFQSIPPPMEQNPMETMAAYLSSSSSSGAEDVDEGGPEVSSAVSTPRARQPAKPPPRRMRSALGNVAASHLSNRRAKDLLRNGQNATLRFSVVEEVEGDGFGSRRQSIDDDEDDEERQKDGASPFAVTYSDIPFAWSVNFNTPFDPTASSAHEPFSRH